MRQRGTKTRTRQAAAAATAVALTAAMLAGTIPAATAAADDLPPQEPGVTLRTYDLARDLSELCTLRSGQTPNVDRLAPTIDYSTDADFGMSERFIAHALANLNVPADGNYEFRVTSDDGSRLVIDDAVVVDHDGLHGAEPKDGTVALTAGFHDLRLEYFENGGDNILRLEWRPPGTADFVIVPESALSTEAGVVRVTAPGTKYCEGQDDSAGDGMRLDSVYPGYTLTDLRPEGFEPMVSGLDWTADDQIRRAHV